MTPREAYQAATARCLALYVQGERSEEWQRACEAADAAWKAMRKAAPPPATGKRGVP